MSTEFRLQDPGEGIHEADILEITVSMGDEVKEGDTVVVAETDKAAVELPAPASGTIGEIKVSEGDTVEVGDLLMVIEDANGRMSSTEEARDGSKAETGKSGSDGKGDAIAKPGRQRDGAEPATNGRKEEPENDTGQPVENAKDQSKTKTKEAEPKRDGDGAAEHERQAASEPDGVLATPVVRGLARDLGIDLASVSGSGKEGRVLEEDVRAAKGESAGGPVPGDRDAGAGSAEDGGERIKLKSVRRAIARRMARSWAEIPHATHQDHFDIAALERLRRGHAEEVERAGGKLTLTPFLMKGLAGALRGHPRLNADFDPKRDEIVIKDSIDIGVAFDTERGLQVPVVREVNRKSVLELAVELVRIAEKLKSERVEKSLLTGGTITLTNVGSIGGTGLSPIINPPQVAIFGAGRAELRQVFSGDLDDHTGEVTLMLPVCLAFDRRVIDGAEAARFMNTVKAILSDPAEFALRG